MFGYVRAREDALSSEERQSYEAVYCGLCRRMGERYGRFSRLFLNYDFVFLAMLLAPAGECCPASCKRCELHPVKGKPAYEGDGWMEAAAGESVILAYWKLRDTVKDDGFFSRLSARLVSLLLRPGYRRAREEYPQFDRQTAQCLDELQGLENAVVPSIDRTADCFARLLQAAAPATGQDRLDRPRQQLLYHLGRWIYLIDALDDLEKDREKGHYNPIAARFPGWNEEDKAYLQQGISHSLTLAGAAFQLLPRNQWSGVLENILYGGLPGVESMVFSGQWRKYQKRHRRNDR